MIRFRVALERATRVRPLIAVAGLLAIASLASVTTSAAAATLNAHGSVGQVYATGLAPGARVSLGRNGRVLAVRSADSLGGVLFRNLPPGTGYRVRLASGRAGSGAIEGAVHASGASQHESLPAINLCRRLRVHHDARRHPARDRRASSRVRLGCGRGGHRSDPHADRVLRLRVRRSRRATERNRVAREPDGVHRRRRQHAGDRLLGWRLRLLRAAPEPRWLRRDRDDRTPAVGAAPQGRHDGHLLRRHQPAVHRADRPTAPGRDLAAVGHRPVRDHAGSRWHPQHRVRGRVGEGPSARRRAGVGDRRTGLGLSADSAGRSGLQGATRPFTGRR